MAALTKEEHGRISAAIRDAEQKTSGEMFVVVAERSGKYRMLPLLWAGAATLAGGFLSAILTPAAPVWAVALGQALALVVFSAAAAVPGWRIRFIPTAALAARTRTKAGEQFLAQNLHATESRTGVLIYVSLAERRAEIVADTAIDRSVAKDFWQKTVDDLTAGIAGGRLAAALVAAVESCGTALAEHFPREPGDENELPDKVVEI